MKNKKKIIAFFGPSAAGKDTLARKLYEMCPDTSHWIVSHTTRPPRDYETEGKDYYFITVAQFTEMMLKYELMEATSYRDWFYGTAYSSLSDDKINIGVFNLEGMKCIVEDSSLDVIPIYVQASDKTRLQRSLAREENPDCHEICRRFMADKQEFQDIEFEHYIIFNEDGYDIDTALKGLLDIFD